MTPGMSVVVAIGSDVVRYGIERMLQVPGVHVCASGEFDPARAEPRIVIVLLSEYGDAAGRWLCAAEHEGVKILVLVDEREAVELARLARLSGIRGAGFLSLAGLDVDALHEAIVRIAAGELPMSPGLARDLLTLTPRPRLTPREQEALHLLVEGLSNKQIARRLDISEHGAKRLVANILSKMDCPNRTLAVAKALRDGIREHAEI
jgi:two-component system nitrate/nitrite response regulator NarL